MSKKKKKFKKRNFYFENQPKYNKFISSNSKALNFYANSEDIKQAAIKVFGSVYYTTDSIS